MVACGLMFPLDAAVNRKTFEGIRFIWYKLPVVGGGGGGKGCTFAEVDPPHPINACVDNRIEIRRALTNRTVRTQLSRRICLGNANSSPVLASCCLFRGNHFRHHTRPAYWNAMQRLFH